MAFKIYEFFHHFAGVREKLLKHYDPMKVYYYNYWIFVLSGFWKYESPKSWKTNLYKLYKSLATVVYGLSFVCFVCDAVTVRNSFSKLSFNMSTSILVLMKMLEIALLSSLRKETEDIYDKLDHHLYVEAIGKSEEDKKILRQRAETTLNITVVFYSLLIIGMFLRIIADTAFGSKGYLIPVPFQHKVEAYYDILYAQQVIVSFHFMMTNLSYDLLGFTFLLRFMAHYEIIEKNLLKIKILYRKTNLKKYAKDHVHAESEPELAQDVPMREANYREKKGNFSKNHQRSRLSLVNRIKREEKTFQLLKESINHHQKLLIEIKNFSEVYSRPLLVQACGMVILIGIVVVQLILLSNDINPLFLQQLLYAITTLLNILCLCSFGSELASKSILAANALYDTPWYEMNVNNRKVVYLVLKRFLHAPELKGGQIITIDRVTCVKFLQSSYNMVALLRNKI